MCPWRGWMYSDGPFLYSISPLQCWKDLHGTAPSLLAPRFTCIACVVQGLKALTALHAAPLQGSGWKGEDVERHLPYYEGGSCLWAALYAMHWTCAPSLPLRHVIAKIYLLPREKGKVKLIKHWNTKVFSSETQVIIMISYPTPGVGERMNESNRRGNLHWVCPWGRINI